MFRLLFQRENAADPAAPLSLVPVLGQCEGPGVRLLSLRARGNAQPAHEGGPAVRAPDTAARAADCGGDQCAHQSQQGNQRLLHSIQVSFSSIFN